MNSRLVLTYFTKCYKNININNVNKHRNKSNKIFQQPRWHGHVVYIIFPLISQSKTSRRKKAIKYIGPLVIYKSIDSHNYSVMTLDDEILNGLFEHETLNSAINRSSQGKDLMYHSENKYWI